MGKNEKVLGANATYQILFFAVLMHLPITLDIVTFPLTLEPLGLVVGLILLVLNVLVPYDKEKLIALKF